MPRFSWFIIAELWRQLFFFFFPKMGSGNSLSCLSWALKHEVVSVCISWKLRPSDEVSFPPMLPPIELPLAVGEIWFHLVQCKGSFFKKKKKEIRAPVKLSWARSYVTNGALSFFFFFHFFFFTLIRPMVIERSVQLFCHLEFKRRKILGLIVRELWVF